MSEEESKLNIKPVLNSKRIKSVMEVLMEDKNPIENLSSPLIAPKKLDGKDDKKKNRLDGMNKIQELKLLSHEDNKIKSHLSHLLGNFIPEGESNPEDENAAAPKKSPELSSILSQLMHSKPSNRGGRGSKKRKSKVLLKGKGYLDKLIQMKTFKEQESREEQADLLRKRTKDSGNQGSGSRNSNQNLNGSRMNEENNSNKVLTNGSNHIRIPTDNEKMKYSVDVANEDFLSSIHRTSTVKSKERRKSEKNTSSNSNTRLSLFMSKTKKFNFEDEQDNKMVTVKKKTRSFNGLSRALTHHVNDFDQAVGEEIKQRRLSITRRNSIHALSRAKTTVISTVSDINYRQIRNDEPRDGDSPKSITLKQDKMEDFNIIREDFRENLNLNLKPDSKKTNKKGKKDFAADIGSSGSNDEQEYKEKDRVVLKKGHVYDSYSDEEEDFQLIPIFYIHPESYFKFYLDFMVTCGCVYTIYYTPLNLAFDNEKPYFINFVFDAMTDFIFLFDFLTGFVMAYFDIEERLITNHRKMIMNYVSGAMPIDILSCIPFNTLFAFFRTFIIYEKPVHLRSTSWTKGSSRVFHSFIILRFFKLFKAFDQNKFLDNIHFGFLDESNINGTILRLIKSVCYFLIAIHMLACVFIFLGGLDVPSWITFANLQDAAFEDLYVASVYFNLTTIFTIGYGDILSKNMYERSFNLFLLVVGILIYSFAVSSLSNIIQSVDEKTKRYQLRLDNLEQLRHKYNLPTLLYDKISRFLKYDLNSNKVDKNEFIQELPIALKNEMILQMYRPIIDNFVFFRNFDNIDFIIRAIMALKAFSAVKNERLVKEGDFIEEILFVKRGALILEIGIKVVNETNIDNLKDIKLNETFGINFNKRQNTSTSNGGNMLTHNFTANFNSMTIKSEPKSCDEASKMSDQEFIEYVETQYLKIIELRRNEHFGDVLMFLNRRAPLSVRVKTKVAELFLMKKTDVVNISVSFPEIFETITRKSAFNQKQIDLLIKRTKLLFYENHKDEFIIHHAVTGRRGTFLSPKKLNHVGAKKTMVFNNPLTEDEMRDSSKDVTLNTIPSVRSNRRKSFDINASGNDDSGSDSDHKSHYRRGSELKMKKLNMIKNRTIISEGSLEEEQDDSDSSNKVVKLERLDKPDKFVKSNTKSEKTLGMNLTKKKTNVLISALTLTEMKLSKTKSKSKLPKSATIQRQSTGNLHTTGNLLTVDSINAEIDSNDKEVRPILDTNIKYILSDSAKSNVPLISNTGSKEIENDRILLDNRMNSFLSNDIDSSRISNSSINQTESNALFNNIANDKQAYPILYNFNINNNYNFDKAKESPKCPYCHSATIPVTKNRNLIFTNLMTSAKVQEYTTWSVLETDASSSFSIIGEVRPIEKVLTAKSLEGFELERKQTLTKSPSPLIGSPNSKEISRVSSFNLKKDKDLSPKTKNIDIKEKQKFKHQISVVDEEEEEDNNFKSSPKRKKMSCVQFNSRNSKNLSVEPKKKFSTDIVNMGGLNNAGGGGGGFNFLSQQSINQTRQFNLPGSPKRANKKSKSILNPNSLNNNNDDNLFLEVHKNIEKSSLNLNDPQFFYSELFSKVMNKKNKSEKKKQKQADIKLVNDKLENLEKMFLDCKF